MSVLLTQTEDTVVLISLQIIKLADISRVTKIKEKKNIPVELLTMLERPTSCLSKIIQVLVSYQYLQRTTFMLELPTADYY